MGKLVSFFLIFHSFCSYLVFYAFFFYSIILVFGLKRNIW
ncbi:MAG: hypothetical protein MRECE_1c109 [Mycoplasmataceae bacterium CE_OT135]|nr:MAG: hypothetical protein MRECE_1c058 [Mycoplasmataceae bacterium CE_OT135]KLL04345.1 MAG: hypothetical protein MRECE_1c109 [Mycoplasmataceae bacterium CE_OT135]